MYVCMYVCMYLCRCVCVCACMYVYMYVLYIGNVIYYNVCVSDLPSCSAFTKSGGKIALSGLVRRQAEVVMNAYRDGFDDLKVEASEEDWVLVTGIKR